MKQSSDIGAGVAVEDPVPTGAAADAATASEPSQPPSGAGNGDALLFLKTMTVVNAHRIASRLALQHTFAVCGPSRGGTTAIAYALARGGVYFGTALPLNLEDPGLVSVLEPGPLHVSFLEQRISKRNRLDVWGFKVPDAVFHLVTLETALRNPIFIAAMRNPLAIARSVLEREIQQYLTTIRGLSSALAHPLQYFMVLSQAVSVLSAPLILVDYDAIKANPYQFVDDLFDLLKLSADSREDIANNLSSPDYKWLPDGLSTSQDKDMV